MNVKLKKRCKTWGCPNLHYNKSGYCDECTAKYRATHPSYYEEKRPDAAKRGYNYRWYKFAKDYLREHPVCAICGKPAEVVDHKDVPADVMMDAYGQFDLDPAHYQALCRRCNAVKGVTYDRDARQMYHNDKEFLSQGEGSKK